MTSSPMKNPNNEHLFHGSQDNKIYAIEHEDLLQQRVPRKDPTTLLWGKLLRRENRKEFHRKIKKKRQFFKELQESSAIPSSAAAMSGLFAHPSLSWSSFKVERSCRSFCLIFGTENSRKMDDRL